MIPYHSFWGHAGCIFIKIIWTNITYILYVCILDIFLQLYVVFELWFPTFCKLLKDFFSFQKWAPPQKIPNFQNSFYNECRLWYALHKSSNTIFLSKWEHCILYVYLVVSLFNPKFIYCIYIYIILYTVSM